jgi:DNA-binding CsgD family transcriptional regulator
MLGTEIKPTTFVFICIELIVLFFQLPNYLSRRQDQSRLRFLMLILAFIFYNVCSGLFPDDRFPIHILVQSILAFGSGILLVSYYFYYLIKEQKISPEKRFNAKVLSWSLILSVIIGFVLTYFFTKNSELAKKNLMVLTVLVSIYFCMNTVHFLIQKRGKQAVEERSFKWMIYSGYRGIIFRITMPIVVFFGDDQTINGLVNISFMITFYAYINDYLFQSKVEYNLLQKSGFFGGNDVKKAGNSMDQEGGKDLESSLLEKSGLTSRELDIAYLILKEMMYDEIALETYITSKTVSKHASNIYKKTNSINKKDFIKKFK